MYAVLDPDGYDRPDEPGFYWDITGKEFYERLVKDRGDPALRNNKLYCPEGSDWLMPLPRQWDPEFYRDSRLDQHVVERSLWTFASGVVTSEFELTRKAGGTSYPKNKWINISRIPAGTTSLLACDYSALWAAAGLPAGGLPAGLVTIAEATTTPGGPSLTGDANIFLPMLQWSSPPPPDDVLVFGWSNLAYLLARGTLTVLRDTSAGARTAWERLSPAIPLAAVATRYQPGTAGQQAGIFQATSTFGLHSLKTLLVGWNDLFVYPNQNPPVDVPLRALAQPELAPEPPFPAGSWWLGAAPGYHTWLQAQVMGFETGETGTYVSSAHPFILWDLGATYQPLTLPDRQANLLLPSLAADMTVDDSLGIVTYASAGTGCELAFAVTDENGNVFDADGTHSKGGFSLVLTPGTPGGSGAYLAPQVRLLELRFPVTLVARLNTPVTLPDTEWRSWKCSMSLSANGKTFELNLKETGAAAYYAAGLDKRGTFPIHMVEDVDDDDIPETIRCRAWIKNASLTAQRLAPDVLSYRLHGVGIIDRLDRKPAYLPQLNNPLNDPAGHIEHTYVAEQVFLLSGIDPATAPYVALAADNWAGTSRAWVPGTWGRQQGAVALRNTSKCGPGWSETWLQYLDRIARELYSWVVYENLDTIWYHPNVMADVVELDSAFFVAADIYRSQATAQAAALPLQYFLPGGTEDRQEPRANRIRVTGKDHEDRIVPWILDSYSPAWLDLTDEDFTGEPITEELTPESGADEESLKWCARTYLTRLRRRKFQRSETLRVPPWRLVGAAAVDVGAVVQLEGDSQAALITHLEVEQVVSGPGAGGSFCWTRITTERLPAGGAAADTPKDYPGGADAGSGP